MTTTKTQPAKTIALTQKDSELWQRYQDKKADNRMLFPTEGAKMLGVSEFELMLSAPHSRYMGQDCRGVLTRLDGLDVGKLESIVRNDYAVHEKVGDYVGVQLWEGMGMMINVGGLDLRYFINRWQHMLAWDDTSNDKRPVHAIAFFDAAGNALNKIYLKDTSQDNLAAWHAFIADIISNSAHTSIEDSDNTQASIDLQSPTPKAKWTLHTLSDTDKQTLHDKWQGMSDVHQFFGILQSLNVDRASSYHQAPDGMACQLDPKAIEALFEQVREAACPIIIFVGNEGVIQIQTGTINTLKRLPVGDTSWLNILDKDHNDFTLHLQDSAISQLWCVKRPTKDGMVTCIEAFDDKGDTIINIFGKRSEGNPELEAWRAITDKLMAEFAVV